MHTVSDAEDAKRSPNIPGDHLAILDTLKCGVCGVLWHKKCLLSVTLPCGKHAGMSAAQKRMSIFGVPLKGHLEAQCRQIPLIMERCVDELQRRGMTCKVGLPPPHWVHNW